MATATPPAAPKNAGNAKPEVPEPKHTIKINGSSTVPDNIPSSMMIGDSVRFISDHGEIKVTFSGHSPFRSDDVTGTEIPSGVILTMVRGAKTFKGHCSLVKHNGTTVLPEAWASTVGVEFPVGHPKGHSGTG